MAEVARQLISWAHAIEKSPPTPFDNITRTRVRFVAGNQDATEPTGSPAYVSTSPPRAADAIPFRRSDGLTPP